MTPLQIRTLFLANQSIGVTEEKPNWGKWVSVYLKFVGFLKPAPWCAAFVSYKVYQAAKQLGVKAKMPKSASCQALFKWAEKRGLIHQTPEAGDVFLVWNDKLNRYAHTGFVKSVHVGEFVTIEGNSNDEGSREGKEVCSNRRKIVKGKYAFFPVC